MWNKIKSALAVLQHGKEVANVEAWKRNQIAASAVVALIAAIVALAKGFGYDVPLNGVQVTDAGTAIHTLIAIAIAAFGNAAATAASSKRAGLLPKDNE